MTKFGKIIQPLCLENLLRKIHNVYILSWNLELSYIRFYGAMHPFLAMPISVRCTCKIVRFHVLNRQIILSIYISAMSLLGAVLILVG